jgi:hypothetical protein
MVFRTERGRVTVVRRAISELIQKAASRTPGVERCRSRIQERGGKLRILLKIHLKANNDLREVERRLETQIADALHYGLGFSNVSRIDTRVVRLVGEPDVLAYGRRPRTDDDETEPEKQPVLREAPALRRSNGERIQPPPLPSSRGIRGRGRKARRCNSGKRGEPQPFPRQVNGVRLDTARLYGILDAGYLRPEQFARCAARS